MAGRATKGLKRAYRSANELQVRRGGGHERALGRESSKIRNNAKKNHRAGGVFVKVDGVSWCPTNRGCEGDRVCRVVNRCDLRRQRNADANPVGLYTGYPKPVLNEPRIVDDQGRA